MTGPQNPVLRRFRPDPSLVRDGEDWWIATSTFEWWPGVALHHSRDLVTWDLVGGALTRPSQLELRGLEPSCGVGAPDLSIVDGLFHLVYTVVRRLLAPYRDAVALLVTATDPRGDWSDPTFLNGYGFDHSLFYDTDGRSWLLWTLQDLRPGRTHERAIYAQEFDRAAGVMRGDIHRIFDGTKLGSVEGPHLYRKDGWYYLVTAEGGTGYGHAVTVARSRQVLGPYDVSPHGPMLTSTPDLLQKAGHGSLAEAADGGWWAAHLCARPLSACMEEPLRRSPLGRETALQQVEWPAGEWPRVPGGPATALPLPGSGALPCATTGLTGPKLLTLREPADEGWVSQAARPGWTRLRGRASLSSRHDVSLLAHRITEHHWSAHVEVDARPQTPWDACGLVAFYDGLAYAWLRLSADAQGRRELRSQTSGWLWYDEPGEPVSPLTVRCTSASMSTAPS